MKKNVYLAIITIVTVICIICGSIYHIIGISSKIAEHIPFLKFIDSNILTSDNDFGNQMDEGAQELDAFTNINADFDVIDLTICTGDSYSYHYTGKEKLAPSLIMENDVLTIKQSAGNKSVGINNIKCDLTITVPADASLTSLELTSDVGDIDIKDVSFEDLTLTADVGDMTLKNVSSTNIVITANVGDIDLKNCSYTSLNITADVGDVSVDDQKDLNSYSLDLSADLGTVKINGKKYSHTYVNGNGLDTDRLIKIHNDMGAISLHD